MQLNEVYQIWRETQQKLHSESATSANFEEAYNQELSQQFNKLFFDQMVEDKQYYVQIFFMNYFKNAKGLPFTNKGALLSGRVEKKIKYIPEIFITSVKNHDIIFLDTLEQLLEANVLSSDLTSVSTPDSTKIFTDYVTYSMIPSLYLMFIEHNSFKSFCELIYRLKKSYEDEEISGPLHYTLSRSLFVSPMFVKFIHQTIYPSIKYIYESRFSIDFENHRSVVQEKMLESFKSNLCFIPSYILIFLKKMKDTKNFLVESLFKPMFENPAHFLVIDIAHTDFEDIMFEIKQILQFIFTPSFIDDIAKIIDSCKDSEKALFDPSEDNENMPIFNKVINSFDAKAFFLIDKMIGENENNGTEITNIDLFSSLDEYLIYKSQFAGEKEAIEHERYEKTKVVMNDSWMHFRKLLKEAPPLPAYINMESLELDPNDQVTEVSFFKMVEAILVDTGDPNQIIDAITSYNFFTKYFDKKCTKDIKSKEVFEKRMKNLVKTHKEQVKAMKIMSQFRNELSILRYKKDSTLKSIQELYITVLTQTIPCPQDIPNANKNHKLFHDILADPLKHKNNFNAYFNKQGVASKSIVGECNLTTYKVMFNRYFHSLNFANYRAYRTDLAKLDEVAQKVFSQYSAKVGENSNKRKATAKALLHLDMFTDSFSELYKAFESNDNPLNKLLAIVNAFELILSYLKNKFGGDGEDDYTPFRNVVISIVNPPYFVSNIVYMFEYFICQKQQLVSESVFNRFFGAFISIFQEMNDNTFVHTPIYYYSRPHHRTMEVFITGSEPLAIIKLLNSFIICSKNMPLEDSESKEYVQKINDNPRERYKKSLCITDFTDTRENKTYSGSTCVMTNIYFGKNIKFSSDPKPDIKIGFYAYKSAKSGFNINFLAKPETHDFVSSQDIENTHKLVIYELSDKENILKLKLKDANVVEAEQMGTYMIGILNSLN